VIVRRLCAACRSLSRSGRVRYIRADRVAVFCVLLRLARRRRPVRLGGGPLCGLASGRWRRRPVGLCGLAGGRRPVGLGRPPLRPRRLRRPRSLRRLGRYRWGIGDFRSGLRFGFRLFRRNGLGRRVASANGRLLRRGLIAFHQIRRYSRLRARHALREHWLAIALQLFLGAENVRGKRLGGIELPTGRASTEPEYQRKHRTGAKQRSEASRRHPLSPCRSRRSVRSTPRRGSVRPPVFADQR
jgi:hypothetical protein